MTRLRPCVVKDHAKLASEWDHLVCERHRQIASGVDLSYQHVIVPTAMQLLDGCPLENVLEIGCGSGDFTLQIARKAEQVIAVDPSRVSIALARRVCSDCRNLSFLENSLEGAAEHIEGSTISVAVAVMTLMTTPDLRAFARALSSILRPSARFIAILTHPCFWPRYRKYELESWFHYRRELFIEAPFSISMCQTNIVTTHIHRPIEQYSGVFREEGFIIDLVEEPMPSPEIEKLYPSGWEFPRFLGLRWEKVN